jgi:hypothetical protein
MKVLLDECIPAFVKQVHGFEKHKAYILEK